MNTPQEIREEAVRFALQFNAMHGGYSTRALLELADHIAEFINKGNLPLPPA